MEITKLNLVYNKKSILKDISLSFKSGEIIGLIGPNGSGKTSLFKCITGLVINYTGIINKLGNNVALHLNQGGFFEDLSGEKNLEFYKNLKLKPKYLSQFEFDFFGKKTKNMSLGMQQMLAITETFQKDANIYLLDEPFNGLDILHRDLLKKHILELKKDNKTIVISSHEISVLQSIIDEVVFIKKGAVIFNGKKEILLNNYDDLENAAIKLFYE